MDIIEQAIADVEKEFCARWRECHSIDFININIPSVARSQRARTSRNTKRQDKRFEQTDKYRTWMMDVIPTPPPQTLLTTRERAQIIDFWVNHFMYYHGEIGDKFHQLENDSQNRWLDCYNSKIKLITLLDPNAEKYTSDMFIQLTNNFTWSHYECTLYCDECSLEEVDDIKAYIARCFDEESQYAQQHQIPMRFLSWNRKIADILVQQHFIHKYTADELLEPAEPFGMAPVLK